MFVKTGNVNTMANIQKLDSPANYNYVRMNSNFNETGNVNTMDNKQNPNNPVNYRYGSYVNYKAFKDYHISKNICDQYFKNPHCTLMAFIIENFHKMEKMPHITVNGERFVMMNSNFILDNLIYLKVKSRMLINYLNELKNSGMIKIHVHEKTNRYINVDKTLIKLYYEIDYTISSTNYLEKNKPMLWKDFVNEWKPNFDNGQWKNFIDDFNATRVIEGHTLNTKTIYEHLLNSVRYHLEKKRPHDRF